MNTVQTPKIPRIIRAHFPPEHLISKDEAMKCHNKLQYDRSLKPHQKELIQEQLEKVENEGLKMQIEVADSDGSAWDWAEPFMVKSGEEV